MGSPQARKVYYSALYSTVGKSEGRERNEEKRVVCLRRTQRRRRRRRRRGRLMMITNLFERRRRRRRRIVKLGRWKVKEFREEEEME